MHRTAQQDGSMHLTSTLQSPHRRLLWSVFAEAAAAEAREHSIAVGSFSLLEFVCFLIDDDWSVDLLDGMWTNT